MTFAEYSNQWMTTVMPLFKPASRATMKSHLSQLTAAFGDQPVDLSYPVVQQFFTNLAQKQAPKTVKNLYCTLRGVMKAALREGLVKQVPEVVLPRKQRTEQQWLSPELMVKIISTARPKYAPFYALLAETGLRIGEALGLQRQDIDLEQKTMSVQRSVFCGKAQTPKTVTSYRTITLSEHLCGLLKPAVESTEAGSFLFRYDSGNPWWPDKVADDFHQLVKDLHSVPVGFHAFRRGNATLMCSILGVPTKIAAYRLGHPGQGITLGVYAQGFVGIDKEWAPKIGEVLYR